MAPEDPRSDGSWMVSSHGDDFAGASAGGAGLQAIQEYFRRMTCRSCARPFSQESIELIREEPGAIVVRVGCESCGHPLGIALIGMNPTAGNTTCSHSMPDPLQAPRPVPQQPKYSEWTKRDFKKFEGKRPINYDDQLDFHHKLMAAGDSWQKFLPKKLSRRT